jgi:integrase
MATFDKTKRVKRHKGGNIRRTTGGGYVAEIYQDRRLHRSPSFTDEQPAKAWIEARVQARNDLGAVVSKLTGTQVADALAALALLDGENMTTRLSDAVAFYISHNRRAATAWTVGDCLRNYLAEMEHPEDGSSPARPSSIKGKQNRLRSFVELHGGRKIPEVTKEDVDSWLLSTGAKGRNLRNNRCEIQSLFNYAGKRMPGGYLNTVARFPTVRAKERPPAEIVEPRHVRGVLHWLEQHNTRVAVGLAIACFAGLRTAEIVNGGGLNWTDIDFDEKRIVVPARLSKTRDRREVRIPDNLLAWLVRYRQNKGRITVADGKFRDWRRRARAEMNATWPENGARHSFGTYYAKLHGYRDTADQLGHIGSVAMLKAHYSGRCTKEQATEYFSITPAEVGKVIEMKQAKG